MVNVIQDPVYKPHNHFLGVAASLLLPVTARLAHIVSRTPQYEDKKELEVTHKEVSSVNFIYLGCG